MRALASCRGPFCREPFHRIRVQDVRWRLCHHRASQVVLLGAAACGSFEAASSITIDHRVASVIVELLRNLANTFTSVAPRSGVLDDEAEASIRRAVTVAPAGVLVDATGGLERQLSVTWTCLGAASNPGRPRKWELAANG